MKKVFLLTHRHPEDVKLWSGIPHFSTIALKKEKEVICITPGDTYLYRFFQNSFSYLRRKFGIRFNFHHSFLSKLLTQSYIRKKISIHRNETKILIAEAISSELLSIPEDIFVILFADATFELLHNNYSFFSELSPASVSVSKRIDKLSMQRANHIIFTSNWARNSAIQTNSIDPNKCSICHFGANIPDVYSLESILIRNNQKTLRFFFPNTDWHRKGGDQVMHFLHKLSEQTSLPIEIFITGNLPKETKLEDPGKIKIVSLGSLDKSIQSDLDLYCSSLLASDFLILLSRSDCTPVAISEAYCCGVPVIVSNVGGMPELVGPEQTGWVIHQDFRFIEEIIKVAKSKEYIDMCLRARKKYEAEFSWSNWVKHIDSIINEKEQEN